jgi:hypothetical protein
MDPCCGGMAMNGECDFLCENYIDEADARETFDSLEDME